MVCLLFLKPTPLPCPPQNRNVSSERSEARRKLRECTGLVDSLMYIVQSQINRKEVDNKVRLNQRLGDELQTLTLLQVVLFVSMDRGNPASLLSSPVVGGEQRVSAEESVLSRAPRDPRLRALLRVRAPEPGPRPRLPEGQLLQLQEGQRSVSSCQCCCVKYCGCCFPKVAVPLCRGVCVQGAPIAVFFFSQSYPPFPFASSLSLASLYLYLPPSPFPSSYGLTWALFR